jgi:acyl carrier protein
MLVAYAVVHEQKEAQQPQETEEENQAQSKERTQQQQQKPLLSSSSSVSSPLNSTSSARLMVVQQQMLSMCKDRLSSYMVPSFWVFLSSLPMTGTGKVDRKRLPWPVFSPSSSSSSSSPTVQERTDPESAVLLCVGSSGSDAEAVLAPRSPLEDQLRSLFAEVLGREESTVSVERSFFADYGGNSLMAAQLAARISACLHLSFSVVEVLRHQVSFQRCLLMLMLMLLFFFLLLYPSFPLRVFVCTICPWCFLFRSYIVLLNCVLFHSLCCFVAVHFVTRFFYCPIESVFLHYWSSCSIFSSACACLTSAASHLLG